MPSKCLIKLLQVSFSYPGAVTQAVLEKFNFEFRSPDRIAIYGPNGCGKSTLLYLLADFLSPVKGERVSYMDNTRTGFVFQDYSKSLLNWYTVEENLTLSSQAKLNSIDVSSVLSTIGGDELPRWIFDALAKYPYELSGGQRQLICLLRALIDSPEGLLLDEPFSSLDVSHKQIAVQLLSRAAIGRDVAWVVVAHDLDDCFLSADRVLVVGGVPFDVQRSVEVPLSWPRSYKMLSSHELQQARERIFEVF